jgi:hypothetical protein
MIFPGQVQTKPRLRYTPTAVEQLLRVAPEVRQGILITHEQIPAAEFLPVRLVLPEMKLKNHLQMLKNTTPMSTTDHFKGMARL